MKYTTISVKLKNSKGKLVEGAIVVRDNFVLATFTDPNLARQLYEYNLKKGKDVAFNEKHNACIEKYVGKKRYQIMEILKKEIIKAGGELTSIKVK